MVYGLSIWCGGGGVIGTSGRTHGAGEKDNERSSEWDDNIVTIWLRSKFSWPVHVLVWYIYLRDEGDKKVK